MFMHVFFVGYVLPTPYSYDARIMIQSQGVSSFFLTMHISIFQYVFLSSMIQRERLGDDRNILPKQFRKPGRFKGAVPSSNTLSKILVVLGKKIEGDMTNNNLH